MQQQIRVGVVGCGEVAQIIHLPALRELPGLFRVTALCDVSPSVLAAVAEGVPGAECHSDYRALANSPAIDAVLVANPHVYHAEVALAAIEAGKHVMIEKPMCVTLAEADVLIAAEARAGVTVQVGYMRRYAPTFVEAVRRVSKVRENVILARVHDVIGPNATIIGSTSLVHRPADIGAEVQDAARRQLEAKTGEAIGVSTGPVATAYALLLGLSSHDISAMRELLGTPAQVLYASQHSGGRAVTAAFDYGTFVCQFATAVDSIPHFEAFLEVNTPDEVIRVDYDTPYIRHLPARLTVTRGSPPAGISVEQGFPTRNDSFVAEWRAFHDAIATGTRPKTSIEDARKDLVLFGEMAALMREGNR